MRLSSLAVIAVVVTGCGASSDRPVSESASKVTEAGTARVAVVYSPADDDSAPSGEPMRSEGVIDFRNDRRRIVTHLGMATEVDEEEASAEFVLGLGPTEVITIGSVTYTKLAGWGPPDKPWFRSEGDGVDWGLSDHGLRDPARALDLLRTLSDEVTVQGNETVRGVPTLHYHGDVDLGAVIEEAPPDDRELLREIADKNPQETDRPMSFDAWVDEDGVARRVRTTDPFGMFTTTVEFYDFGVEVDVEAPPADQVMTDEEMVAWVRKHGGSSRCDEESPPEADRPADVEEEAAGEKAILCVQFRDDGTTAEDGD
jgi:hypothetical protein